MWIEMLIGLKCSIQSTLRVSNIAYSQKQGSERIQFVSGWAGEIHCTFQSSERWLMGGEGKAQTSFLIKPGPPSLLCCCWQRDSYPTSTSQLLSMASVHPHEWLQLFPQVWMSASAWSDWPRASVSPCVNREDKEKRMIVWSLAKCIFLGVSTYCFSSWSFRAVNLVVPTNLIYHYRIIGYYR